MASNPVWLPLPAFPGVPALMVSPRFASSSYTVHVTDLARTWSETLERRAILLRSLQEDTSIDLSDGDPEQWSVFMSKLKAAFDPASADHRDTSLSLSVATEQSSSPDSLTLRITCVLPKPLKPLEWPVHLAKQPPSSLTSELVLPLVQAHHARIQDMRDLVDRLREKDVVIKKLVDKLGGVDTGLESVFNALSGRRKVSRATAEDKVKALAPFNEDDWRAHRSASRSVPQDALKLIQDVCSEGGLQCNADAGIEASSQLDNWWTQLDSNPTRSTMKVVAESPRNQSHEALQPGAKSSGEGDDDDFEIQSTPPHLRSPRDDHAGPVELREADEPDVIPDSHPVVSQNKPRSRIGALGGKGTVGRGNIQTDHPVPVAADDDETASDSDQEPENTEQVMQPKQRLGVVGKTKRLSPSPVISPAAPTKDDDETASGSGSEDDNDPKPSAAAQAMRNEKQKSLSLGRIGGKPKPAVEPTPGSKSPTPETRKSGSPVPAQPLRKKIGAIGSKSHTETKRPRTESPAKADEPVEPETDEQKAERKRAELAQVLEKKAAAPAKKKRKF